MAKIGEALTRVNGEAHAEAPKELCRIRKIAHQVLTHFEPLYEEKFTPGFLDGFLPRVSNGSRRSHLGSLVVALHSRGYNVLSSGPEHFSDPGTLAAGVMHANSRSVVEQFRDGDPHELISRLLSDEMAVIVNGGAPRLYLPTLDGVNTLRQTPEVDASVMAIGRTVR